MSGLEALRQSTQISSVVRGIFAGRGHWKVVSLLRTSPRLHTPFVEAMQRVNIIYYRAEKRQPFDAFRLSLVFSASVPEAPALRSHRRPLITKL